MQHKNIKSIINKTSIPLKPSKKRMPSGYNTYRNRPPGGGQDPNASLEAMVSLLNKGNTKNLL